MTFLFKLPLSPVQTTSIITGLAAGTYTVNVTDSNGCTTASSIKIIITQPSSDLGAKITIQKDPLCYGSSTGTATVHAYGGTAPYIYVWNSHPLQTDSTAINLTAGMYTVIVQDAHGCLFNA